MPEDHTPAARVTPTPGVPEADRAKLDAAVSELRKRKGRWGAMTAGERLPYLRDLRAGLYRTAAAQVKAAVAAQGVPYDDPRAGEQWLGGPFISLRWARLAIRSLEQVEESGSVRIHPDRFRQRRNGQVVVRVFPHGNFDRAVFAGFTADVWLQPGIRLDQARDLVAVHYKGAADQGTVQLVLGAGNVASIAPLDAAYKLFAEGKVVLLKLNPVNDYLAPFLEQAFARLIDDGFVRIVRGGAAAGDYLCRHPGIDEIHITGSERTHDAIVWGSGAEAERRRSQRRPRIRKPMTSELGNVSPILVVPGKWSARDLQFHAENLATQMTQNGGFNCNATKVIVTAESWPQRDELLERLRSVLADLPPRPAYYPGAQERYNYFLAAYPQAERLGPRVDGCLQPALAVGVDPTDRQAPGFTSESFCAFTVETSLPAGDAREFLQRGVEFCNDVLHGTLNAGLIVDAATERELRGPIEDAVANLRYGSVGLNQWPAIAYGFGSTPWGGFPGQTPADIQSGIGVVHNALLFDHPQKSFCRGPFRVVPRPPWFVTHRNAHRVGRLLVDFEAKPSMGRLARLLPAALRA